MVTAEGWQLNQGQTKELLTAGGNGKEEEGAEGEEDECAAFIRKPGADGCLSRSSMPGTLRTQRTPITPAIQFTPGLFRVSDFR